MRIDRLSLANFRGFETLEVEFEPELTALIGRNGSGKSTLMRALTLALSHWTRRFADESLGFARDDIRWASIGSGLEPQLPGRAELDATLGGEALTWSLRWEGVGDGGTVGGSLPLAAAKLQAQVTRPSKGSASPTPAGHDNPTDLPLVAAFAARLGARRGTPGDDDPKWLGARTLAYRGALADDLDLGDLSTWLTNREKALNQRLSEQLDDAALDAVTAELLAGLQAGRTLSAEQILRQRAGVERAPETAALVGAVLACLDGARDLRFDINAAELRIVWADGRQLPFRLLSDGQKRITGIAARLAWLAYRLNPHHGADAAARTTGVVLIDEIELHLHPEWQQTVVGDLRRAFPRLQFIITTHSAQVLSTVHARNIRRLTLDAGAGHAERIEEQTRGVESGDVMTAAMRVSPVPDVPEWRALVRYRALIEDGLADRDDARALRAELDAHFGPRHQLMVDCDRLIRFVRFTRGREAGQ